MAESLPQRGGSVPRALRPQGANDQTVCGRQKLPRSLQGRVPAGLVVYSAASMEIDTGSLTGAAGGRNSRGVCLRLSTRFAARLLAFGFLATFLIAFGIGFACAPAAGAFATRFRDSGFTLCNGAHGAPPAARRGAPPRAPAMYRVHTSLRHVLHLERR